MLDILLSIYYHTQTILSIWNSLTDCHGCAGFQLEETYMAIFTHSVLPLMIVIVSIYSQDLIIVMTRFSRYNFI